MSPARPATTPRPLAPGEVAFLVAEGSLGPAYTPVEVVKVNKATVQVRHADGELERVTPEAIARRTAAALPTAPASRAEATVVAFREATEAVERAREEVFAASTRRRAALEELRALGWSITDMSERLGLSRGRINQILKGE